MADDPRFNFDPGPDPRALAFLEGKGVKQSWRWTSMWQDEHAYAFTLAGVHRLDVLAETKRLVTEAVAKGETLQTFRGKLAAELDRLGFSGPQLVEGFQEGPRKVDLSAPWRTKIIYDTNVRQAYMAAKWQVIEDTVADFPALRYDHHPRTHPRWQHAAWNRMVFLVTDPFWDTHYPINAFGCNCDVTQVSIDKLTSGAVKITPPERLAATGYSADPRLWPGFVDRRTGREMRAPVGISPGFANNVGKDRRRNLGQLLARRVEALDPDMARAASADLVNLPAFSDLVEDAVRIGVARAAAAQAVAARLAGGSASRAEISQVVQEATTAAGEFPRDSWPVGVAPADIQALAPDKARLVVANASAIGHSHKDHPTTPADWRRVQLMLERGDVWREPTGALVVFARFLEGDVTRTWSLALKPVDGAWRVRTLFATSPSRRARKIRKLEQIRFGTREIALSR